jgi:hypothetical protein
MVPIAIKDIDRLVSRGLDGRVDRTWTELSAERKFEIAKEVQERYRLENHPDFAHIFANIPANR